MVRVSAISVLLFLSACAGVPAEEASGEEREVQVIVRNTASPFCPGKTLDSCPSPKAGEWRREIREWVSEGVPESAIRDRLQARVPGFDLNIPPVKSGWVIPLIALALSTGWFIAMARRFRRRGGPKQRVGALAQDHGLDARLDEELAALD